MSLSTVEAASRNITSEEKTTYKSAPPKFQEPKPPILLIASMLLFQSILSACKMELTGNLQGISISFNMQDVAFIACAAWMLHRGLSTRNIVLVFPWVSVTLYGLYFNHYKSLRRMIIIMKAVRNSTALPWIALFLMSMGLVLRVMLILRILQLAANLWYRKKLEKELYETLN